MRSVNGSTANAEGEVTLGADVIQYKPALSSIKSVAGSFTFDSYSGISADDLPAIGGDWMGVQFGTKTGNDKTQFIFNNKYCYYRYDDATLGNESWDSSSWKKYDLTDLAQDSAVVHLAGTDTIDGTKFFTGSLYADVELIRRSSSDASRIVQQSTVITKGEIPDVGKWYEFAAVDSKGLNQVNRAGSVSIGVYPTGDVRTYLRAYQWKSGSSTAAAIYVGITPEGDSYTWAPNPVTSSNASWGRRQARTPATVWGSVRAPQAPHVAHSLRRTSTSLP